MTAQATAPGVYQVMHNAGDIFEVPDELFSSVWMQEIADPTPETQQDQTQPDPTVNPPEAE